MAGLTSSIARIVEERGRIAAERALLTAISGIDASGKGYLTAQLAAALQARGYRVANINIDGWLNLPRVRFHRDNSPEHFYLHAIRFEEMFRDLILPLRERRSVALTMDFAEETAAEYRKQSIAHSGIDIVLLEGIYLFKRAFQHYYDLAFWIDCSFETALERAIARGQEGLSPDETIRVYETLYFPAQEIHFARDNPKASASVNICNDPRLQKKSATRGAS